jgi:hypothetical protein
MTYFAKCFRTSSFLRCRASGIHGRGDCGRPGRQTEHRNYVIQPIHDPAGLRTTELTIVQHGATRGNRMVIISIIFQCPAVSSRAFASLAHEGRPAHDCFTGRPYPWRHSSPGGRGARFQAIFTYSKSPGWLLTPSRGGAIQLAYLPARGTASSAKR